MSVNSPTRGTPRQILHQVFGYTAFRPLQEAAIDHVCQGGDALLIMPTGSGKSLCFQIPALVRPGLAVIISPLIALMHDQVTALQARGVAAAFLNSSQTAAERQKVRRQLLTGQLDLLYVAPERLLMPGFAEFLDQFPLSLFAIDEAHCVSAWGHDFRPDYLELSMLSERYPQVPRMALTATADPTTRNEIIKHLNLQGGKIFSGGFDRPNLYYQVRPKSRHHRADLLQFIEHSHSGHSGIVYRLTRAEAEGTAAWLTARGVRALPYHAGMTDEAKEDHQNRFLHEPGLIIVATIAFGMGVNKPDVRFVAHLDMPKSLEDYHQQTGRAGRDGLPAEAWLAYGVGDLVKLKHFINTNEAEEKFKEWEYHRLQQMERFCTAHRCRRHLLLKYFGEQAPGRCDYCDNCAPPPPPFTRSAPAATTDGSPPASLVVPWAPLAPLGQTLTAASPAASSADTALWLPDTKSPADSSRHTPGAPARSAPAPTASDADETDVNPAPAASHSVAPPVLPLPKLLTALAAVLENEGKADLTQLAVQLADQADRLTRDAARNLVCPDDEAGAPLSKTEWETVLAYMLMERYLVAGGPGQGTLAPGPRAGELIRQSLAEAPPSRPHPSQSPSRPATTSSGRKSRRSSASRQSQSPELTKADARLYEKLVAKRLQLARQASLPAFFIFSNSVLRELSQRKPLDTTEMMTIRGIGPLKIKQYGAEFLQVITNHCSDST